MGSPRVLRDTTAGAGNIGHFTPLGLITFSCCESCVAVSIQWCFPFRRQHDGVAVPVTAKANGARKLQAVTEITRLATIRRICVHASMSQPYMTNAPRPPGAGLLWIPRGVASRFNLNCVAFVELGFSALLKQDQRGSNRRPNVPGLSRSNGTIHRVIR